jgi:hypothetical protein
VVFVLDKTAICKDRLTVKTTWQLNIDYICQESMSEGLGTAAKTVMEITSFLFPDDIPKELINIGSPAVHLILLIWAAACSSANGRPPNSSTNNTMWSSSLTKPVRVFMKLTPSIQHW